MDTNIPQQTPQKTELEHAEVSLGISFVIIAFCLLSVIGLGIFVGKKFFWNQYDQTPVVDRQINRLTSEIAKDPAKPDKYIELGNLYLERKDWAKAEEAFKNSLRVEPKGTRAQYNLAVTYMAQNRYQDAAKVLEPLASQYPNLDYIQFNTGVTEFNLGKYDQAIGYLKSAIKLQPGGSDIWYYLGQAYEKSDRKSEAVQAYEKAISFYPGYKEAQVALNRVKNK